MPAPIDPEKRAAIIEAARASADGTAERSAGDVAREFGVHASTVTKIARDAGIVGAWQRRQTKNATQARQVDMAAERTRISARLLREADRFLDRLHVPFTAYSFGGKDNTYAEREFSEPPVDAGRQLMTSAAIAIDKHVVLDRHDNDGGAAAALSMMGRIAAAIADVGDEPYVDPNTATPVAEPEEP